ncbi:hypothetical protein SDRG_11472 [Saprolegnia diclina VS20]|uniref:Methyltransferase n=1 Tax=Saprolegnia diclina (strain VS20) TaxID=1156394 RepID=T0REJ0_SAPDV|nr:hypothetical protein SDRG_11472 [Saprolegnia diclina VS20]EQC30713.1 hypothetical protein SDRG_11472 [Saprolegnia diclina VS20]|eukprot:XP_008615737.1 hypothetical protein SDRG_11472 [Saprolegnia diclina VS20]
MISSESSDSEVEQVARRAADVHATKAPSAKRARASSDADEKSREEILAERQARRKQKRVDKQAAKAVEREQEAERLKEERRTLGRRFTVSIAVPGSIVDNAQTKELKTYLAGQIARAAAIFQVDEVIVFDDQLGKAANDKDVTKKYNNPNDCHVFLGRILQYLETPQYLRKALFPVHSDLKYAGLLNPLDCPHHMRGDEWTAYREGVVVDVPGKEKRGSHVNVGLKKFAVIDKHLQPGVRVTVKLDETSKDKKKLAGTVVSPAEPREQLGEYWGYTMRLATSLKEVWTESPYKKGYDLKIGTSERGTSCVDDKDFKLPPFEHVLIVFGGVSGIEECTSADESIAINGDQAHTLFDMWVNTCPQQGSRTIRSEEAILISMSALRSHLMSNQMP